MGPCFISTEDPSASVTIISGLWASMGPCFISTEDTDRPEIQTEASGASMGPCFISTEDTDQCRCHNQASTASMGPCFISTEDASCISPTFYVSSFNGAVLHQHGRPELCEISGELGGLQWGRASSARKTRSSPQLSGRLVHGFNGAVLHQHGRPPCNSPKGTRTQSFNGAVLHQHGRRFVRLCREDKAV